GMSTRAGDPAAALELHARLLGLCETKHALELRTALLTTFGSHAAVVAAVAAQLDANGQRKLAEPLLDRVCGLHPELPAARVRAGLLAIEQGDVERARERLRFLEDPECGHTPQPLWPLAEALSEAGEHRAALDLFEQLVRREPHLALHHNFRADVARAQK